MLRCFSERPFRSGTSSLSYFFSEQPLIWATSALICLPASSSVASVTHDFAELLQSMRLAPSSCNPVYWERRSITHAVLRAAVSLRLVISCSGTGVGSALLGATLIPSVFRDFLLSVQSRAHFASLTFHKCLWRRHYAIWMCKSSSRHSPVHFLSATFPVRTSETKTLLRRPRKPLHAKKTHSFAFERS